MVVKRSGIVSDLFQDRSVEGVSKQENLQELLKGIAEFCEIRREEGMEQVAMSTFWRRYPCSPIKITIKRKTPIRSR